MISQRDTVEGRVLVSVAAVIQGEEKKILLVWEGDMPYHRCWVVPGGYVKPDETVLEALVREVREETGLETHPTRLIGIYDDFLSEKNEQIRHIILGYESTVIGGRILITREATEYAWLTEKDIRNHTHIPDVFKRVLGDSKKQRIRTFVSRLRWLST